MGRTVDADLTLSLAFLAGLAGAGHCWSMCGGFAGGMFLTGAGGPVWFPHLAYHGGRILAYTLIGALAAAMGRAVVLTGGVGRVQGGLYIVAGCLVLLAGARVAGFPGFSFRRPRERRGDKGAVCAATIHPISPPMAQKRRSLWSFAGFLHGLMPCALVFSLALKAASAPSVAIGAAWLFAFGLGTVPAMALAGGLARWLGLASLRWLRIGAGLLVMALGLQAVWSGSRFFHVMLHL